MRMGKEADGTAGKALKETYSAMQIQWVKEDVRFVKVWILAHILESLSPFWSLNYSKCKEMTDLMLKFRYFKTPTRRIYNPGVRKDANSKVTAASGKQATF